MTNKKKQQFLDDEPDYSDYNSEEIEDSLIKDSVLQLTSNVDDEINPDEFFGAKLRNLAAQDTFEAEYKGVPVSRKKLQDFDLSKSSEDDNNSTDSDADGRSINEDISGSSIEDEDESGDEDDDEEEEGDDCEDGKDISKSHDSRDFDLLLGLKSEHVRQKSTKNQLDGKAENECSIYSKGSLNVNEEIKKGNAIRQQYDVWDSLLESRIKLQKCLAASNRLPQKEHFFSIKSGCTKSDQKNISKTCKNLSGMLQMLLDLQEEMFVRFPELKSNSKQRAYNKEMGSGDEDIEDSDINDDESISSSLASGVLEREEDDKEEIEDNHAGRETEEADVEPPKKQRKLEDYSKELLNQFNGFLPARNEAIQKWNDKTRVSSGRINSSNFSAFDQSTLKQIENILCDKERLIKRTQTKRSVYRILGSSDDKTKELDQVAEYDSEIFDDDDFYHKLLRDLIEQRSADVMEPNKLGRQWLELQKVRSKMKRSIDVKSTKGRRLRYTVHKKLLNFMAPIPYYSWTEEAESELFSSLFGTLRNK